VGVALWWLLGRRDTGLTESLHYVTANGQIENITLPDGSLVALNAGSTLDATAGFGGKERRVKLSGEAFFQVQSDRNKPFLVDAAGATVRVVGTKFNVRAYPSSPSVVTSVAEGKVEFFTNPQNKVQLTPGMEGTLEKAAEKISTRPINAAKVANWQQGILAFENAPLGEALETIGRHYKVSVKIEDNIEGKQLFSTFENEPLKEVVKTLNLTYALDFKIENDTLFVRSK
jgi:ferric-dicitrate binding protein FerR (iron transport regulator)